jgi:hypothetical protein
LGFLSLKVKPLIRIKRIHSKHMVTSFKSKISFLTRIEGEKVICQSIHFFLCIYLCTYILLASRSIICFHVILGSIKIKFQKCQTKVLFISKVHYLVRDSLIEIEELAQVSNFYLLYCCSTPCLFNIRRQVTKVGLKSIAYFF